LKSGDVVVVGGLMKVKEGMPAEPNFDFNKPQEPAKPEAKKSEAKS